MRSQIKKTKKLFFDQLKCKPAWLTHLQSNLFALWEREENKLRRLFIVLWSNCICQTDKNEKLCWHNCLVFVKKNLITANMIKHWLQYNILQLHKHAIRNQLNFGEKSEAELLVILSKELNLRKQKYSIMERTCVEFKIQCWKVIFSYKKI
jgi:hypothetical protein